MAVDEQIARAWRRLIGNDHGPEYEETPDPATQPWEWVKALCERDYMSIIGMETAPTDTKPATYHVELFDDDGQTLAEIGATPEAALEAAIRAWENSQG